MKLFSYVVQHDLGYAPHATDEFCTLALCKFRTKHRNIIELAEKGDWIVGTGGVNRKVSAGHGKLIYAMRVDEKLTLSDYLKELRFLGRKDNYLDEPNRFVLISQHFFYFGRNALNISEIPFTNLDHPLEKKGPGFRHDFSDSFINNFSDWLKQNFEVGKHGSPCGSEMAMILVDEIHKQT